MERVTYFFALASVLVCGYIYVYTLSRREERGMETWLSAAGYLLAAAAVNFLPLEAFKNLHLVCLCLCFPFLLIFLYRGWEIKIKEAI